MLKRILVIVTLLAAATVHAYATPVEVGRGVNTAHVCIKWSDGFSAEFLVHFGAAETDTTTGLGLLDTIEANTTLTTVRQHYSFGDWVEGIAYQGHSDDGTRGDEPWWHYWENDAGSRTDWTPSRVGAAARVVHHGDSDSWIYGSSDIPSPASGDPYPVWYGRYQYDANDFAVQCVAYNPVGMKEDWLWKGVFYNDPNTALGRPTVDTTSDGWFIPPDRPVPVVPVYPPSHATELVYLGEGGSITLAFNHPVRDDPNNPYGLDLTVFSNPLQCSPDAWTGGDPLKVLVSPTGISQPGIVSVSQDGITWYSFTNDPCFMAGDPNFVRLDRDANDGPFCGGFAPTLGRVYTPEHADANLGDWNHYWGEPTNPTLPLNPTLSYASFNGCSVARVAQTYGDSAGGTSYDIARLALPVDPETGLKWFTYVRIDGVRKGGTILIDAVADVGCPGDFRHSAVKP